MFAVNHVEAHRSTEELGDTMRLWWSYKGKPGIDTLDKWFKLEEHMGYYKLSFCPIVCDTC